ncbi:hypothetical protein BN946_scf184980.g9 [Trametes cinnabarina]|uniref:MOCS2A n=1 Tax=Pycnoporus cinnabarinus TaxID=5643 RepID=A0A060SJ55_PYCCI|nr:hypothetical protein BN946_scf184980.g9 [Trametes cinnabarina]
MSGDPPTVTVLYFAAASTATGLTTEAVALDNTSGGTSHLRSRQPRLAHVLHSEPSIDASTALLMARAGADYDRTSGGLPLSALADVLVARHPGTGLREILAQSQWAVDEEMVDDPANVVLKGGEEVAVICPVSGG